MWAWPLIVSSKTTVYINYYDINSEQAQALLQAHWFILTDFYAQHQGWKLNFDSICHWASD